MPVPSAAAELGLHRLQRGDAVLGRGVGREEIVHSGARQGVDDEEMRHGRVPLGGGIRDLPRGIMDLGERRGERRRAAR